MPQSLDIGYILYQIYLLLQSEPNISFSYFESLWIGFNTIAGFVSLLLITGIVYTSIRTKQVKADFEEKMAAIAPHHDEKENPRWSRVLEMVSSINPSDWRQAVLEADVMLNDLLDELGYLGDGVGEKLKSVSRGDFRSIDQAWEGHKVRNRVAHAGTDFILTQREARRAIENFEQVFREFGKV